MADNVLVDVERPYEDVSTISLAEAVKQFRLDPIEIDALKQGEIVWCDEVALTINEAEKEDSAV